MSNEPVKEAVRPLTPGDDIFRHPGVDIYSQMAYIVLKNFASESAIPELSSISKLGRMSEKQAVKALQRLVDLKLVSSKLYRRMVGDFQDDRLSWTAKGLFLYCKDNPQIQLKDLLELAGQSGEDEQSIRKAIRELSKYGYLDEYPEWRQIAN